MAMKRVDVYIREDQFYFITSTTGNMSEHIRLALDGYIKKLNSENVSASSSKGGNNNG